MQKSLLFFFILLFSAHSAWAQECAGYPAVKGFKSDLEDFCLGLVATKKQVNWTQPRQVLFLDDQTLLVSDFHWKNATPGRVWQLNLATGESSILYSGGNLTHALGRDSFGRVYIGNADKIVRIDNGEVEDVLTDLPAATPEADFSHPLKHFILLPNNDLVVNVGSPSDRCDDELRRTRGCKSRDQEVSEVRLYPYNPTSDSYDGAYEVERYQEIQINGELKYEAVTVIENYQVIGKGLRNSMGLLFNPLLNVIYQAENSIDIEGTPEEFNVMPLGQTLDFGWPYCYGMGRRAPRAKHFKTFCGSLAEKPLFLVPQHSSPLDMDYYYGRLFPEIENAIVMGWHGWRRTKAHNNALVAYPTNSDFSPVVTSSTNNDYITLLTGEDPHVGLKIRPVGVTFDSQGQIWFADDKTKRIYVISKSDVTITDDQPQGLSFTEKNQLFVDSLSRQAKQDFAQIYKDFKAVETCAVCHGESNVPADANQALVKFLNLQWIAPGMEAGDMEFIARMVKEESPRSMPPPPAEKPFEQDHPEIFQGLKTWLDNNL